MLESILYGLLLTLSLTTGSLLIGFLLAILWVYCLGTSYKIVTMPIRSFIYFTRSVPLLVQIFMFYYGLPQLIGESTFLFWDIIQHPLFCALFILSLNSSAYTAVLLESNLQSISKGEKDAAKILHLSYFHYMKNIVFPRLFSSLGPAYSNEVLMVLKSTSLVGTITLIDLMAVTKDLISKSYLTIEFLIMAGFLYLLLAGFLLTALYFIQKYVPNFWNAVTLIQRQQLD